MHRLKILLYLAPVAAFARAIQVAPITSPASEVSMFRELAETGVVGVLAAVLLWLYRNDHKESEARLAKIAEDYRDAMDKMFEVIGYLKK